MSVNIMAVGIHIPKQDIAPITCGEKKNHLSHSIFKVSAKPLLHSAWGSEKSPIMHFSSRESSLTHRSGSVHPDDGALLVGGNFPVDVNTLLNVEQHGHHGHEGERGVKQDPEDIELCSGETHNTELTNESRSQSVSGWRHIINSWSVISWSLFVADKTHFHVGICVFFLLCCTKITKFQVQISEWSRLHHQQQGGGPAVLRGGGTGSTGVSVLPSSGHERVSSPLKRSPCIQNTSSIVHISLKHVYSTSMWLWRQDKQDIQIKCCSYERSSVTSEEKSGQISCTPKRAYWIMLDFIYANTKTKLMSLVWCSKMQDYRRSSAGTHKESSDNSTTLKNIII